MRIIDAVFDWLVHILFDTRFFYVMLWLLGGVGAVVTMYIANAGC